MRPILNIAWTNSTGTNGIGTKDDNIIKKRRKLTAFFLQGNYCNHTAPQDWISITYLLFYIIVYVVVIALAQEVKRRDIQPEVRMTITIMGCVIFSLDICQFEFFNSDLVPHQWNSSLFWTSNLRDHPKRSNATAGNIETSNFYQYQNLNSD